MNKRMKSCPVCGFEDRKTLREAVRLWRVNFGDLPIWEMMKRRWISIPEYGNVPLIREELCRFFGVKTDDELTAILNGTRGMGILGLNVCSLPPSPLAVPDRYIHDPTKKRFDGCLYQM